MPLSEEEQRILHEMEEKLYEHDRAFADRVSTKSQHHPRGRSGRGWVVAFVAGFVLLLVSFGSSVLLGSLGFLIMLGATLALSTGPDIPTRLVSVLSWAQEARAGATSGLRCDVACGPGSGTVAEGPSRLVSGASRPFCIPVDTAVSTDRPRTMPGGSRPHRRWLADRRCGRSWRSSR